MSYGAGRRGRPDAGNAGLVEEVARLTAENETLRAAVGVLEAVVAALRSEVEELRARLGQDSSNSSRPPSSDGLAKPAPRSLRRSSGKRAGGQDGHPGATLRQVECPDETRRHEPWQCAGCGAGLDGCVEAGVERRQVFDVEPARVWVVEHQVVGRRCGRCGTLTRGAAPAGAGAPVQYGPGLTAMMVYLCQAHFLPVGRTAQAVRDMTGVAVSAGTVAALVARAGNALGGFTDEVADKLAAAPVANFDETGLRVGGKLRWVHSASTTEWSLVTVHDKRGRAAMDDAGVLPRFDGVAVHDAWAPYDSYHGVGAHQLCCAHALRELKAVEQAHLDPEGCWAARAARALVELNRLVRDAGPGGPDPDTIALHTEAFTAAALAGLEETTACATKLQAKHHALARRLSTRREDYLRFTTDPGVPFDNNAAEREIRMVKLRQKVSGCLRTVPGARQFAAVRSYLATTAKHGLTHLDALTALCRGHPWMPAPT